MRKFQDFWTKYNFGNPILWCVNNLVCIKCGKTPKLLDPIARETFIKEALCESCQLEIDAKQNYFNSRC